MSEVIKVQNLTKTFKTALSGYFTPKHETFPAVNDISFEIKKGERVAFIGPNGAGKSTTIKLLTGILQPCSGSISILGLDPFSMRKKVAYSIGTVFGQKSGLWYHLPPMHSFSLLATIYDIDRKEFTKRLEHLTKLFDLDSLLFRPVKELSLGQRMRCELVASLLHSPKILFLDEPTIGLDIISKDVIRELIHQRADSDGTTIFLTSHDVADIERVCDRILLINKGKIVIDDSVKNVKARYIHHKRISVKSDISIIWKDHSAISLVNQDKQLYKFEVDLNKISPQDAVRTIATQICFSDITIEDLPLEDIIKGIYQG